jgi:N-acetyl-gamma-glutamyl-phosphate reductase
MAAPLPVAVVGASGYTGAELLRLLFGHPHCDVTGLYARKSAGRAIDEVFRQFVGLSSQTVEAFDADAVANRAQVAFCALPHGHSATVVAALRERGLLVVDLSADFRLRDADEYAKWYGSNERPTHPAPHLLEGAVYGLPERYRAQIADSKLIASPGCYPTSAILAIAPLIDRGLVATTGLVVDAKSGASGAGRSPALAVHLPEAGEGVRAYKVAGAHRHTAEIEQELGAAAGGTDVRLTFTPHLLPMSRGILSCVYAAPTDSSLSVDDYRAALVDAYDDEPFVAVLPAGTSPDTAHVRTSNMAHVSVAYDERAGRVLAMSAIDNLVKGAAGQAIQSMNVAMGWDERAGLRGVAAFP